MSILAGIIISIACAVYLSVGGVAGALLFATGLLGILFYQMKLFTGKAGLLVDGGITLADLAWKFHRHWHREFHAPRHKRRRIDPRRKVYYREQNGGR